MGINLYYNRQPRTYDLYAPPLELAYKALESAQKRYDTNYQAALKASQIALNALPGDQPTANEFQKKYATAIDEGLAKAGGDYSQLTGLIQNLDRQLAKDLAPGSKYYQVKKNYEDYSSWYNENLKNKDIDPENLSGYSSHFLRNYKPVGEPDPTRGYTQLALPKLPKMTDWFGDVDKAMSSLKPEEYAVEQDIPDGRGGMTRSKVKRSGVELQRALNAGMGKLMSDPYYRADRQFKAQFMSTDELQQMDMMRLQQMAQANSYESSDRSTTLHSDTPYWERQKLGLSRAKFNWDKQMDMLDRPETFMPEDSSKQQYTAGIGQKTKSLSELGIKLADVMSGGQTSKGFNLISPAPFPIWGETKETETTIYNREDVNAPLLKAIIQDKFKEGYDTKAPDFKRKMDEAQFEYDQSVKQASSRNVMRIPFGNAVAKALGEEAHRLLSSGAVKASTIWDKDSAVAPKMEPGVSSSIKELLYRDGKPVPVRAVGFIGASQGIGEGNSLEVTVDGKSILLHLDDQATDDRTKAILGAYDKVLNKHSSGNLIPTPEQVTRNGVSRRLWVEPAQDFSKGSDGLWKPSHKLNLYEEGDNGEFHPIERGGLNSSTGQPFDYDYLRNMIEGPILRKHLPLSKGVDKLMTDDPEH